ncbi:MAG: hypothetical protein WBC22_17035, partial [Sedimentisphaerales bacterium]
MTKKVLYKNINSAVLQAAEDRNCLCRLGVHGKLNSQSKLSTFTALDLFKSRIIGIICPMKLLRDRIKGFFLPTFSELSLFMMGVAFVLVFLSTQSLRSRIFKILDKPGHDPRIVMLLVFFVAGLVLSLYHVFAEREKTRIEKYAMLFFAVMANAFCGIWASIHILGITAGEYGIFSLPDIIRGIINGTYGSVGISRIFLILPIWNIINCLLLLISFRAGWINERNISDEKADRFEVLFGFLITVAIFVVCQFLFKLYWAITFSIC